MKNYLYIILLIVSISSCKKNNKEIEPVLLGSNGIFVVNEGNFTWANSSLSFYDFNSETLTNDVFAEANGIPLGDVAYSVTIYKNKAYIVVNNSGLIYVVNIPDMKFCGKITGLVSPRQIYVVDDTLAYVTDLYNTKITKVNLQTLAVTGYVNIGSSTENILLKDGKVYVSSWSYNNKIYSFDAITGNILDSVSVGKQPNSMVFDKNGNLWVLCDGCFEGSPYGVENASLWCLDPVNFSVIKQMPFADIQDSPIKLCVNALKDTLFYINDGVYKQPINESVINSNVFIPANGRVFYGLLVNPLNENVIVSDAKNYMSKGDLFIYSNNGELNKSMQVGVNPGWLEIVATNP